MGEFRHNSTLNVGKAVGFVLGLLLFTTILFFLLKVLNRLSESWNYFSILTGVVIVIVIGLIVRSYLK
tara:strand:- start:17 stop:220 length:204 start_codon:yes stop_codon:yes gene_type:complete